MIHKSEEMLTNIWDYFKHSNITRNTVKFVQHHGNQDQKPSNQTSRSLNHIGQALILRNENKICYMKLMKNMNYLESIRYVLNTEKRILKSAWSSSKRNAWLEKEHIQKWFSFTKRIQNNCMLWKLWKRPKFQAKNNMSMQ